MNNTYTQIEQSASDKTRIDYPNGNYYIGEVENNLPHGYGIMYFSFGLRFEGFWKEGKEHGKGTLIDDDGSRDEGEYTNGNLDVWSRKSYDADSNLWVDDGSELKDMICP